jgi:hypothetical protein
MGSLDFMVFPIHCGMGERTKKQKENQQKQRTIKAAL